MVHAILANIWWSRMKHFYMIYTVAQFSYELLVKLLRVNLKHPVAAPHCSKAVKCATSFPFALSVFKEYTYLLKAEYMLTYRLD